MALGPPVPELEPPLAEQWGSTLKKMFRLGGYRANLAAEELTRNASRSNNGPQQPEDTGAEGHLQSAVDPQHYLPLYPKNTKAPLIHS